MNYISLFSGIEAVSVAALGLDFKPLAFVENDKWCCKVLQVHYPDVPNLGDITTITNEEWSKYAGSCDLVAGGSPCQSFSKSGDRLGLRGASGLMLEYIRAVAYIKPKWFLWENVPGALTSTKGEDFRCLLTNMEQLGYCMAWRILDAQYFGVPQRRKRVFLVGYLGDNPEYPAEVLFDQESGTGYPNPLEQEWKETTRKAANSVGECFVKTKHAQTPTDDERWIQSEISPCLNCFDTGSRSDVLCVCNSASNASIDKYICGTLCRRGDPPYIVSSSEVRHLTPVECERLQGFPDNWTACVSDSQRYKMLGNTMAVPVIRWILKRIKDGATKTN